MHLVKSFRAATTSGRGMGGGRAPPLSPPLPNPQIPEHFLDFSLQQLGSSAIPPSILTSSFFFLAAMSAIRGSIQVVTDVDAKEVQINAD